MKKLILIMIVFLLSCGYATIDTQKTLIITGIENHNDPVYCYYFGKGSAAYTNTMTSKYFMFVDSCGKFQIGDTIKLTK